MTRCERLFSLTRLISISSQRLQLVGHTCHICHHVCSCLPAHNSNEGCAAEAKPGLPGRMREGTETCLFHCPADICCAGHCPCSGRMKEQECPEVCLGLEVCLLACSLLSDICKTATRADALHRWHLIFTVMPDIHYVTGSHACRHVSSGSFACPGARCWATCPCRCASASPSPWRRRAG